MPREPGYNETAFVRRETTWRPAQKAWHVVDKDGNFARNGFSYEYSADLVTCADVDWPANAPHKAIPLYDMATLDRYYERNGELSNSLGKFGSKDYP